MKKPPEVRHNELIAIEDQVYTTFNDLKVCCCLEVLQNPIAFTKPLQVRLKKEKFSSMLSLQKADHKKIGKVFALFAVSKSRVDIP